MTRPPWDEYFLNIAHDVSRRSNCIRRQVGAIIVKGKAIISTGYNGTPIGVKNCYDGGCPRCQSEVPPGQGYDTCLCVHAEQNAIVLAARYGAATDGSVMYTTLRPCFGCIKEAVQAGIVEIVYDEDDKYEPELEEVYLNFVQETGLKLRKWSRPSSPP